jgi:hypothetical protein
MVPMFRWASNSFSPHAAELLNQAQASEVLRRLHDLSEPLYQQPYEGNVDPSEAAFDRSLIFLDLQTPS